MSEQIHAEYFGKRFVVPNYFPTVVVGSTVSWLVESKRKNGPKPFVAYGRVVGLRQTTFGGSRRKLGAKIQVSQSYLDVFPNRKYTTVSVDKLKLVASL